MKHPIMAELVATLRRYTPQANLELMIRQHRAALDGHCPQCRTVGPCTLYTAALAARRPNGTATPD